jgi:hypothetical protein
MARYSPDNILCRTSLSPRHNKRQTWNQTTADDGNGIIGGTGVEQQSAIVTAMNKNNNGKQQQQQPVSPRQYMNEQQKRAHRRKTRVRVFARVFVVLVFLHFFGRTSYHFLFFAKMGYLRYIKLPLREQRPIPCGVDTKPPRVMLANLDIIRKQWADAQKSLGEIIGDTVTMTKARIQEKVEEGSGKIIRSHRISSSSSSSNRGEKHGQKVKKTDSITGGRGMFKKKRRSLLSSSSSPYEEEEVDNENRFMEGFGMNRFEQTTYQLSYDDNDTVDDNELLSTPPKPKLIQQQQNRLVKSSGDLRNEDEDDASTSTFLELGTENYPVEVLGGSTKKTNAAARSSFSSSSRSKMSYSRNSPRRTGRFDESNLARFFGLNKRKGEEDVELEVDPSSASPYPSSWQASGPSMETIEAASKRATERLLKDPQSDPPAFGEEGDFQVVEEEPMNNTEENEEDESMMIEKKQQDAEEEDEFSYDDPQSQLEAAQRKASLLEEVALEAKKRVNEVKEKNKRRGAGFGILVICDGHTADICAASVANKRAYAKKHEYDLIFVTETLDTTRPMAWSKILAVQRYLPRYKWLLFLDIDTLIMNPDIRLEDIADEQYDQVLGADHNGINSGVWFVKNTRWTRWFLTELWAQEDLVRGSFVFHYEQRAFHHLFQTDIWAHTIGTRKKPYDGAEDVRKRSKVVNQCVFNSLLPWYVHGDFVVHFAGMKGVAQCYLFWQYYEKAKKHLPPVEPHEIVGARLTEEMLEGGPRYEVKRCLSFPTLFW